ncbi:MAG TPA: hypothetical protein VFQ22_06200 [Longimicrobiales bacterium]|nr:hypothetical protein [Longimicrobiales bacterium]
MRKESSAAERQPGPPGSRQGGSAVKAVFRDVRALDRAVRQLASRSVPVDAIRVYVVRGDGRPAREIPVEGESGAARGAFVGAGIGAAAGLVLVALALLGVFGEPVVGLLGGFAGGLRVVALAALAGVPLGALLGMGRWRAGASISDDELSGSARAVVVVHSPALAARATEVLEASGAERVEHT